MIYLGQDPIGITTMPDVSGKADKVVNAVSGNFAALNSSGNLIDSGHSHADYVQKTDYATQETGGVVKIITNGNGGFQIDGGYLLIKPATRNQIKISQLTCLQPIVPAIQDASVFYGLAKAAGDTTQAQSDNEVGTYTTEAKTAIQSMLDVPSKNAIAPQYEDLTFPIAEGAICYHDGVFYMCKQTLNTSEEWTPSHWRESSVGDRLGSLYSNLNTYANVLVTRYMKPSGGIPASDLAETYVKPTDYATANTPGVVKASSNVTGIGINNEGYLFISPPTKSEIKAGTDTQHPVTPSKIKEATFYGLAQIAGDTTQSESNNAVGTYTDDAKAAIRNMLGVSSASDVSAKADKTDTVLETTLSRGRKKNTTVGMASFAFGLNVEASGTCSRATGITTKASGNYSIAEGYSSTATGQSAHAEGSRANASGINSHSEGTQTTASAEASHSEGTQTTAGGTGSHAEGCGTLANTCLLHTEGRYNQSATIYPEWAANTAYVIGDKVSYNNIGFMCIIDNSDAEWNNAHWQIIYHNSEKALIIGNGTSDNARSNAYALDWTGNAYYMGNVYVGAGADSTGGTKLVSQTDYASSRAGGVVRVSGSLGLGIATDGVAEGTLFINPATPAAIKTGENYSLPIVPAIQSNSVFYGLAKAAGDTTQSQSSNAVGTYTDDAKAAIRSMLGAVGDTDYAVKNGVGGIVRVGDGGDGVTIASSTHCLYVVPSSSSQIKTGLQQNKPIVPNTQHESTFYGLAKAAGDTTQSESSNAVGTYTSEAKAAIQNMLGVESGVSFVEQVNGTTPTITGIANTRYICGEVTSISITPPSTGIIDVTFTSGTTPAVLTIPNTVIFPAWFDSTALDANKVYEINIADGTRGVVTTW